MTHGFNWICPYCGYPQTVTSNVSESNQVHGHRDSRVGPVCVKVVTICCANPDCKNIHVVADLCSADQVKENLYRSDKFIESIGILPRSIYKAQPPYVPQVLIADYYESCLILNLSPKASATLSRRCLQGMIRDFCGISRATLDQEVRQLKSDLEAGSAPKGVDGDLIDAIDAIRKIGNIGAHMEKDINVIVDVDPDEAQTLIELVELLFKEWYVARHDRQQRIANISAIARAKSDQKTLSPPEK